MIHKDLGPSMPMTTIRRPGFRETKQCHYRRSVLCTKSACTRPARHTDTLPTQRLRLSSNTDCRGTMSALHLIVMGQQICRRSIELSGHSSSRILSFKSRILPSFINWTHKRASMVKGRLLLYFYPALQLDLSSLDNTTRIRQYRVLPISSAGSKLELGSSLQAGWGTSISYLCMSGTCWVSCNS